MPTKSMKIDVEALKHLGRKGEELPHLVHLSAVKARKIRSHILTLIHEAQYKKSINQQVNMKAFLVEELAIPVRVVSKPIYKIEKHPVLYRKTDEKSVKASKFTDKRFSAHLSRIIRERKKTLLRLEENNLKLTKEERRYKFIQKMLSLRAQDEQVSRLSSMDASEAIILLSVISGSMKKQAELYKQQLKAMKEKLEGGK